MSINIKWPITEVNYPQPRIELPLYYYLTIGWTFLWLLMYRPELNWHYCELNITELMGNDIIYGDQLDNI